MSDRNRSRSATRSASGPRVRRDSSLTTRKPYSATSARRSSRFSDGVGKSPEQVAVTDVESWRGRMEEQGLKPNTVYTRVSLLASFFQWLMREPVLGLHLRQNPARTAMPKRPPRPRLASADCFGSATVVEVGCRKRHSRS
ncbi:MAG: site-specific integrase [Acidobacteria bacterium]|nr:site-specific integrase [Acidobacteriota bacterium]